MIAARTRGRTLRHRSRRHRSGAAPWAAAAMSRRKAPLTSDRHGPILMMGLPRTALLEQFLPSFRLRVRWVLNLYRVGRRLLDPA